jgi:hypothetical protein
MIILKLQLLNIKSQLCKQSVEFCALYNIVYKYNIHIVDIPLQNISQLLGIHGNASLLIAEYNELLNDLKELLSVKRKLKYIINLPLFKLNNHRIFRFQQKIILRIKLQQLKMDLKLISPTLIKKHIILQKYHDARKQQLQNLINLYKKI